MKIENLYTKDCIRTFTGKYLNIFDPNPDDIVIEDIAHALSRQCRFGGHLEEFYSVAQHSIECASRVSEPYKLQALLHDASEAFILDIPTPIKPKLTNYAEIENNLMLVISSKFGFTYPLDKSVKDVDKEMLIHEWNTFVLKQPNALHAMSFSNAKYRFLSMFLELTQKL